LAILLLTKGAGETVGEIAHGGRARAVDLRRPREPKQDRVDAEPIVGEDAQ
jgi:hypothetical protein